MITFISSIILLILAYFTYGKIIEKIFMPKVDRPTPAYSKRDDIDYLPMNKGKNSLIQLLNIAGTGPIFGPIMGALYGPVAFVWIVIGCIFAGAVHDYLTGMISIRNGGSHLPQLAGKFLGKVMKHLVNFFSILLLVLVGTVFIVTPADLLNDLMNGKVVFGIILAVIFGYYFLSTILPIDKIIGKLYPILGAILIISAVGIGASLIITGAEIPELTFENMHPGGAAIFPLLFLTISCGAISGFHATQTPLISRTMKNEKEGRFTFYGMMIAEGIIAMIWAAATMSFFDGQTLQEVLNTVGPAGVVKEISISMLGAVGGTLAVLGAIVLPITSGDTAFRAARNIIADYLKFPQVKVVNRLLIAVPLFVIAFILTKIDFTLLWRYFSFANQSIAMLALWVGAMYLVIKKRNHWVATIPAIFLTSVVFTYILNAEIGFNLNMNVSIIGSLIITAIIIGLFIYKAKANIKEQLVVDEEVEMNETIPEEARKIG